MRTGHISSMLVAWPTRRLRLRNTSPNEGATTLATTATHVMADAVTLHDLFEPPPTPHAPVNNAAARVIFRHPGYPDARLQNRLLTLYAWDQDARGRTGLHARTALLACGIIACNSWNGYLTAGAPHGERVDAHNDTLLTGKEYWFHVPHPGGEGAASRDAPYRYPVCPSFDDWVFPHDSPPSEWLQLDAGDAADAGTASLAASAVTAAVLERDKGCVVSRSKDYIERAHLCPRSEVEWFKNNGMDAYNGSLELSGDTITDDASNAIALRPDIHRAFDDCKFVIVPKRGQWALHFLELTNELGPLFHNRPIQVRRGVSPEFLLVRFAWAVIPLARTFLEKEPAKEVRVAEKTPAGLQETTKTLSAVQLLERSSGRRGRSGSPKKRKASESGASLPGIPETKRACVDYSPTPSLIDDSQSARDASQDHEHDPEVQERARISLLRQRALKAQRPTDPSLVCCDYNAAEKANALGIDGPREYGGGHLCMACLGTEVADAVDEEDALATRAWLTDEKFFL